MHNKSIDIIIYDHSVIIKAGLKEMISNAISQGVTISTCSDRRALISLINSNKHQLLIAKPELLDGFSKKDFPRLKRICIIYAYYDSKVLEGYDGTIQINDSQFQISELIYSLNEPSDSSLVIPSNDEILSIREIEVLKLLVSGLSTKELSDKLFISVHTVNNHRKNIIKKLGISTISGLTIYAVINELIDPKKVMDSMK